VTDNKMIQKSRLRDTSY